MAEFIDFLKYFKEVRMIGTIRYVNEKEGQRGKYLTLALESGQKGLIVNDEKIMEAVKEGETYNFTLEKSGIFTIVIGIEPAVAGDESEKPAPEDEPSQVKPQKPTKKYTVGSPPMGGYKASEYMKKRTPKETKIIAKQAFAKSLIEAYARLWVADRHVFKDLTEFDTKVVDDANFFVAWLEIEKK